MEQGLKVQAIIKMIPNRVLDELGRKTGVDRNVKKLSGKSLFQLFLFSLISSERISLRVMENYYQAEQYKSLAGEDKGVTKHSSLSDRLRTIKVSYFEEIFNYLITALPKKNKDEKSLKITSFDSTLVTLSSKLLQVGLPINKGARYQIKFTVALEKIPRQIKIFSGKAATGSEEIALKEAIMNYSEAQEGIVLFDRGMSSRKTYRQLDEHAIQFITRLNDNTRYKRVSELSQVKDQVTGNLQLEQDVEVQLATKGTAWLASTFRLIIAKTVDTGKRFYFLTNIKHLEATAITEIYKRRWEIEVFFRFIKQELNAKHFISRDLNGISVTIYMIMILAMMLLIYKLSNKLEGFKIVKLRFRQELEMEIMKDIIVFCGGDPSRLAQRWRSSA